MNPKSCTKSEDYTNDFFPLDLSPPSPNPSPSSNDSLITSFAQNTFQWLSKSIDPEEISRQKQRFENLAKTWDQHLRNLEAQLLKELNDLEKEIEDLDSKNQSADGINAKVEKLVKYINNNRQNVMPFLENLLSTTDFENFRIFLDEKYDSYYESVKTLQYLFPILQSAVDFFKLQKYKKDLEFLCKRHKSILEIQDKNSTSTKRIEKLDQDLSKRMREAIIKGGFPLIELASIQLLPAMIVSIFKNFENKQVLKIVKLTFRFFKKGKKVFDFSRVNALQNNWSRDLKPKINITPSFTEDFQSYLKSHAPRNEVNITSGHQILREKKRDQLSRHIHAYEQKTHQRAYSNQPEIDQLLIQKKEEFSQKMNETLVLLDQLNSQHSELGAQEFAQKLKEHGFVNISSLRNREEWNVRMKEQSFKEELCRQALEHQMTVAKLIQQGMQEALSAKIGIEKKFLIFNFIRNIADVVSTLVQMILVVPKCAAELAKFGIDKLLEALPIKGIGYSFVVNPDLDLSPLGLLWMALAHIFGYIYKPNEYSLESYWIDLQKKWTNVYYLVQNITLHMIKWSFGLIDKLIQLCIRNKTGSTTYSYKKIDETLEKNRTNYALALKKLDHRLQELKLKDIKQSLNPQFNVSEKLDEFARLRNYLVRNNCPKELINEFDQQAKLNQIGPSLERKIDHFLRANHLFSQDKVRENEELYDFDTLKIMTDALNSAKLSMFPQDVKDFFKENANIDLEKEDESNFSSEMKKLFIAAEEKFFKTHTQVAQPAGV